VRLLAYRRLARWPAAALILAAAVLAGGASDVFGDPQRRGPWLVAAVAVAGMGAATLWRRQAPLAFTLAIMALIMVLRTTVPNITDLNFLPIFMLLVPPYTVAAHEDRVRSGIGLAACLATYVAISAIGSGRGTWYFAAGMGSAAWAIGRAVRARRLLAAQLQRRNERLTLERADREALALAQERTRIANELNQVVADCLCAAIAASENAQRLLGIDPAGADKAMESVENTARITLSEVRRILGALRRNEEDRLLSPQPGIGELHSAIDVARGRLPGLDLHVEGVPGAVPASLDLAVYRLVQDALGSVAVPSDDPIDIAVRYADDVVELEIAAPAGSALAWPTPAMGERVALCRGTIDVARPSLAQVAMVVRMPRVFDEDLT
jgi:signal transduction histidine kinase